MGSCHNRIFLINDGILAPRGEKSQALFRPAAGPAAYVLIELAVFAVQQMSNESGAFR